jgi:NAD(P)-dependent dehydrogenase (short-subunit alcohol dehydrogenase family)
MAQALANGARAARGERNSMAVVLVTGADRGIANAICRQLFARGDSVIAACLGDSPELRAAGIAIEPRIDVTSDKAVGDLAKRLKAAGTKLDWLLNVAGVLGTDTLGQIDPNDVRRQFEINALGPLRVTQALLDLLKPGAKVGIVTSRVGSLGDNTSGGFYAYRMSKAAANMLALNLHHDLTKRGVSVLALHPGMVRTQLTKGIPGTYIEPEEAARGLIRCMDELSPTTSGRFRHANGEYLPW